MVFIENNQNKIELTDELRELIETVVDKALKYEGIGFDYDVNVYLVDNEAIKEINKDYRKIDKVTDVLSFPMIDFRERGGYEVYNEDLDPETKNVLLGEIILSLEKAMEQSREYEHPFRREVAFLIVHSVLHLLGYDHEVEEERKVMRQKEEEILQSLGITR
ncbi:MAG: rRNA maturation RNase YbeY [Caloramator sp.]|nr:rRNA maturation RNase YbeY [Caloramator sp.]